jgi:hypothetical protein
VVIPKCVTGYKTPVTSYEKSFVTVTPFKGVQVTDRFGTVTAGSGREEKTMLTEKDATAVLDCYPEIIESCLKALGGTATEGEIARLYTFLKSTVIDVGLVELGETAAREGAGL